MTPDQVFSIVNVVAVAAWVLLAVLPRRRWVVTLIAGMAVPAMLAAVYVAVHFDSRRIGVGQRSECSCRAQVRAGRQKC